MKKDNKLQITNPNEVGYVEWRYLQGMPVGNLNTILEKLNEVTPTSGVTKAYVDKQDSEVLSTATSRIDTVDSKQTAALSKAVTEVTEVITNLSNEIVDESSTRETMDSKLQVAIDSKQDILSSENAGENITITQEGGIVKINTSGSSSVSKEYVDTQDNALRESIATKQDILTSDNAGTGITITTDSEGIVKINSTNSQFSSYGRYFYGMGQDTLGVKTNNYTFPIYSTSGILKLWISPAGSLATNYTLASFNKEDKCFNSTGWQGTENQGWIESREIKDSETGLWWCCRWSAGGSSPLIYYLDVQLDYDNMIGHIKWMCSDSKGMQDVYVEQISDINVKSV